MVKSEAERAQLEETIKALHEQGRFGEATRIAITGYGAEIYGYLLAILRSRDAAGDVFIEFCENVEAGFPRFEWRCKFRTWAYAITRRAARRFQAAARRQWHRQVALCDAHTEMLAQASRTPTHEWLKSSVRLVFQELRRQLPEEDQTILILRLDRDLSWEEVAIVTGEFEGDTGDEAFKREVNRVKTRFNRAKGELKELGIKAGLITPQDESNAR